MTEPSLGQGSDLPIVLATNDDGFQAPGLAAMVDALSRWATVVVVAPETEHSACSHKITLNRALRIRGVEPGRYVLDGTPADCVYVAMYGGTRVAPRRPDLVVAGLNRGVNLGMDVYYSGTVAAAREAAIRGVPGLALSAELGVDLAAAAAVGSRIARALFEHSRAEESVPVLNVNIPPGQDWIIRSTKLGRRVYGESVEFRRDPRGREYLWLGGPGVHNEGEPGTDTYAFEHGEIGVSSLPLLSHAGVPAHPAEEVARAVSSTTNSRREE